MKALRLHGVGELRLHDEPEPEPSEGEAVLDVTAVGLCGSDRHWFAEGSIGDAVLEHPLVLGHEFVGVVASGPWAGRRVVVDPADPCGRCAICHSGRSHLCPEQRFAGHGSTDGALRTRLAWPERLLHPLPDSVPDVEGALIEPLAVALHALELSQVRPGTIAGVFGCGPLGLLLLQLLRMVGTSVVVQDPISHRLAAAERLGATRISDDAVDVAFEVAGDDGALTSALEALRPGGRVVLVGIPDRDRTAFTASTARRKELTLALCRRMTSGDLQRAIRLADAGCVDLSTLVTGRYPLPAWEDAFDHLVGRRGLKAVVEPQAAQ